MILRQFLHSDPVGISYLFGCGGKAAGGRRRSRRRHRALSATRPRRPGMRILYVIDTHIHADHVSAGRALAEAAGAEYVLFDGRGRGVPVPRRQRRRCPGARQRHRDGHAHARPHAGAHLASRDRPHARRRALVRADRPHADGRRSRPHRTRRQRRGRRAGPVLAASQRLKELPDHVEVLPGAYSGLGLRALAERQADVHHRLREAPQQGVPDRGRGRVRPRS